MNEKKPFFEERTAKEIKDLKIQEHSSGAGLVDLILGINPAEESILVNSHILPESFYKGGLCEATVSRRYFRHGTYVRLSTPFSLQDTLLSRRNPLGYRVEALKPLEKVPEEKLFVMGYEFRPPFGADKRKRRVTFVWDLEGARLHGYAEKMTTGVTIDVYADARKVATEGASVVVRVPSRTAKHSRRLANIQHVPVVDNQWKRAVWRRMTSSYQEGSEVPHRTFGAVKFNSEDEIADSDVVQFYPHDMAGYWAGVRHFIKMENRVPWDMDPFAKPSGLSVNFYNLLNNNVLIQDATLKPKARPRKLHLAEKSVLLGRLLAVKGHDATFFWDPKRDPKKLADYDWSIPGID